MHDKTIYIETMHIFIQYTGMLYMQMYYMKRNIYIYI